MNRCLDPAKGLASWRAAVLQHMQSMIALQDASPVRLGVRGSSLSGGNSGLSHAGPKPSRTAQGRDSNCFKDSTFYIESAQDNNFITTFAGRVKSIEGKGHPRHQNTHLVAGQHTLKSKKRHMLGRLSIRCDMTRWQGGPHTTKCRVHSL